MVLPKEFLKNFFSINSKRPNIISILVPSTQSGIHDEIIEASIIWFKPSEARTSASTYSTAWNTKVLIIVTQVESIDCNSLLQQNPFVMVCVPSLLFFDLLPEIGDQTQEGSIVICLSNITFGHFPPYFWQCLFSIDFLLPLPTPASFKFPIIGEGKRTVNIFIAGLPNYMWPPCSPLYSSFVYFFPHQTPSSLKLLMFL